MAAQSIAQAGVLCKAGIAYHDSVIAWSPSTVVAFVWELTPLLAFGLCTSLTGALDRLGRFARSVLPSILGIPYVFVTAGTPQFRWTWLVFYLLLPVAVAAILADAARRDPEQRGSWHDFVVLILLGCAVDLRWLESAWPPHLAVLSKLILLDAGLYGFTIIRRLTDVGYDLRVRLSDVVIGLRELLFFAPVAVTLGLALGFLHWHRHGPGFGLAFTWLFTFFFIAIPEEIFFRGWLQNLLERRFGVTASLLITAAIFGLAHFNKRSATFNWRYVLLAAIAGIFYGRAWRAKRRIAASAITHASVDAIWSFWLL